MASVADLPITRTHGQTELWSEIIDDVNEHGQVLVRSDAMPDVVVMSVDKFEKLQQKLADDALAGVRAEWDRRLAVLNEPDTRDKMRAFMDSTPEEFAAAANAAEQRRRKG